MTALTAYMYSGLELIWNIFNVKTRVLREHRAPVLIIIRKRFFTRVIERGITRFFHFRRVVREPCHLYPQRGQLTYPLDKLGGIFCPVYYLHLIHHFKIRSHSGSFCVSPYMSIFH